MSNDSCRLPVIIHGRSGHYEYTDPTCTVDIDGHTQRIPCQWSWPYAHGRARGGQPFPSKRLSHCRHIRRSGQPEINPGQLQEASG